MAKRKKPAEEQSAHADKDDGYKRRPRRDGDDDGEKAERQIFEDLVQRRLGGGAAPTSEAYAKAMQQWQALPGAVQFVAVPQFPKSDLGGTTGAMKRAADPNTSVDTI
jgi:hypothetical protein